MEGTSPAQVHVRSLSQMRMKRSVSDLYQDSGLDVRCSRSASSRPIASRAARPVACARPLARRRAATPPHPWRSLASASATPIALVRPALPARAQVFRAKVRRFLDQPKVEVAMVSLVILYVVIILMDRMIVDFNLSLMNSGLWLYGDNRRKWDRCAASPPPPPPPPAPRRPLSRRPAAPAIAPTLAAPRAARSGRSTSSSSASSSSRSLSASSPSAGGESAPPPAQPDAANI